MTDGLCCICEGVFVSSCGPAWDEEALARAGITHIVDAAFEAGESVGEGMRGSRPVLYLQLKDRPEQSIMSVVPRAVHFIANVRQAGGRVLIHCESGVSRAGAIATAYVMKTQGVDVDKALEIVRVQRPCIQPNSGFIAQLKGWYDVGMYMGSYDI